MGRTNQYKNLLINLVDFEVNQELISGEINETYESARCIMNLALAVAIENPLQVIYRLFPPAKSRFQCKYYILLHTEDGHVEIIKGNHPTNPTSACPVRGEDAVRQAWGDDEGCFRAVVERVMNYHQQLMERRSRLHFIQGATSPGLN